MIETDFHQLDECACGGTYACWTYHLHNEEMKSTDYRHFSSWHCPKCGDLDYKYYDEEMEEID